MLILTSRRVTPPPYAVDLLQALSALWTNFPCKVSGKDALGFPVLIPTSGRIKNDEDEHLSVLHPVDSIVAAIELIKIDFQDVSRHFNLNIKAREKIMYSYPLFTLKTSVGLILSPNAHGQMYHVPITVASGSTSFHAALRVRIQAGTTVEVFGLGVYFELGVFGTVIEYKSSLASTSQYALQSTELLDTNIGPFVEAVAVIDYKSFGASPTKAITIVTGNLYYESSISTHSTRASNASYSGENHSRPVAPTGPAPSARVTSTAKPTSSSSHQSSVLSSSTSDDDNDETVPTATNIQILTPDTLATPIVSTIFIARFPQPTYNVTTTHAVYTTAFPQWNATGIYTTTYIGPNSVPVVVGQASDAPGVTATGIESPAASNTSPAPAAASTTKASSGALSMRSGFLVAAVVGFLGFVVVLK
ncbi:hypothetical protein HYALB_00013486 [Hymenoscyphus albidus]|uniref:Uncharacterized protein n=1 Tax=Hymenoscyphus albidus TaxID=595503 RepID=A0A9N9Q9R7_9HELO|nr:hypothetical protein HYALB_00013486 [Hymenoscyphus albidus]